jgi:RNA polymerase sigma factor (sigma-70 family)
MATATSHPLIHHIRRLVTARPAADQPDAHLLRRFSAGGDSAAFEVLVKRHGPLVLGVCRRVLGDWHAAEDAFQNTFALLAQKAGSLRQPEALAPWLYGVAYRTALKARARTARRGACERAAATEAAVDPVDDLVWRDLRVVLDEAVGGLPEKYRTPVVLHYLQGVSVAEVAGRLGWPRGTVATRLARARERLRRALARRGVALSAGALAALGGSAASARVPTALLASTIRAAAVAAGRAEIAGVAFSTKAGLAQGGTVMLTTKVKVVALVLLALGVAVGGGAPLWGPGGGKGDAEGEAPKRAARAASPEGDLLLFLDASTHFFREEYGPAARVFNRLLERHPDSRLGPDAAAMAVLARRAGQVSAADARRLVAEGRARIATALGAPTRRAEPPGDAARDAERDFRVAEFYRRTGHPGSACFYYELVSRRYPRSPFAARAAGRLRELRKQTGEMPQADGLAPARVGRIVLRGNHRTPDALIRYQLALHPGQVLTYPALSAAERNLGALRGLTAVVSVTDAKDSGEFKDVLIQLEEKFGPEVSARLGKPDFSTPVLPPLRRIACSDPPDRATILRALPRSPQSVPGVCEVFRDDFDFTVEVEADQLDAPRFYPLIGIAQLHRCHYRCVVFFDETVESGWPFAFRCKRRRSEVVYLDRDHLHLVREGPRPGAGAATPAEARSR